MPCQQHRVATSFVNKDVDEGIINDHQMSFLCTHTPIPMHPCIQSFTPKIVAFSQFHTCKIEFAIGHGYKFSKHE
jgi:hypothetical protein